MSYAVIQLAGKQYKVSEGQKFDTNRLPDRNEGDTFDVTDVLLVADDKSSKVGTPLVKGATVTVKVLEHNRDKKIIVLKYKSKSKYRKRIGHKQHKTVLEVVKIKS